jgi:signal transducing adaptor molecule
VQNCQLALKQEVCSRPFLQQLTKLLGQKTLHISVKNRILELIQTWATDFQGEPSLDYMDEIYKDLKQQGYEFISFVPSPKKGPSAKEREEEDLQLALAMSLSAPEPTRNVKTKSLPSFLFKVRALYDFAPTENGELGLRRGDVIEVHDNTTFPDWWKGTCKGQGGIFPANYVEKIGSNIVTSNSTEEDEASSLLRNMPMVREFVQDISKADPLGHNISENEKLQV